MMTCELFRFRFLTKSFVFAFGSKSQCCTCVRSDQTSGNFMLWQEDVNVESLRHGGRHVPQSLTTKMQSSKAFTFLWK